MRKLFCLFAFFLILFAYPSITHAAETIILGPNNFSFKVDYINFHDKNNDDSYYIAAEGYKSLTEHVYMGAEVGHKRLQR